MAVDRLWTHFGVVNSAKSCAQLSAQPELFAFSEITHQHALSSCSLSYLCQTHAPWTVLGRQFIRLHVTFRTPLKSSAIDMVSGTRLKTFGSEGKSVVGLDGVKESLIVSIVHGYWCR